MRHALVMGDPAFFRIKGGLNPYARTRWGFRKRVDRARAVSQWERLRESFESLGAKVFVLPAFPDLPGLAFPANAGFVHPKVLYPVIPAKAGIQTVDSRLRGNDILEGQEYVRQTFYLSNLSGHRSDEQKIYREFFSSLGFSIGTMPYPFEGEADFFPCGEFYIFTYGTIRSTGFRLRLAWPPYQFQYSHRSDERNESALKEIVKGVPILKIRLIDVRYYHGDTCLFAFGPKREYLFAYLDAIDEESRALLKDRLGERLIPLSQEDAERFIANSIQIEIESGPHIVFPTGVAAEVTRKVSSLGIPFTTADVSEFFEKGGGSVKCMICDLGPWV